MPNTLPDSYRARQNVIKHYDDIRKAGGDPDTQPWIIDCDSSPSRSRAYLDYAPCITRSRYRGFWVSCLRRRITPQELLKLQGFDTAKWRTNVGDNALGKLAGNSMCTRVVEHVLRAVLPYLRPAFTACPATRQISTQVPCVSLRRLRQHHIRELRNAEQNANYNAFEDVVRKALKRPFCHTGVDPEDVCLLDGSEGHDTTNRYVLTYGNHPTEIQHDDNTWLLDPGYLHQVPAKIEFPYGERGSVMLTG